MHYSPIFQLQKLQRSLPNPHILLIRLIKSDKPKMKQISLEETLPVSWETLQETKP